MDTVFKRARAQYLNNLTSLAARQEFDMYNAIMDAVYGGPRLTPTVWGLVAANLCVDLSGDFARLGPEIFSPLRLILRERAGTEARAMRAPRLPERR